MTNLFDMRPSTNIQSVRHLILVSVLGLTPKQHLGKSLAEMQDYLLKKVCSNLFDGLLTGAVVSLPHIHFIPESIWT